MIKFNLPVFIFLVSFFSFGNELFAQEKSAFEKAETRMRHDVAILASDSLQGREAATVGEQMASDYIAKRMHAIGLLPKGEDEGSYLSEFRMSFPVVFKAAKLRINTIDFIHNKEFGATDLSSQGNITAQLVNIDNGVFDNWIGKAESVDVQNKIVVMDIAGKSGNDDNEKSLNEIVQRVKTIVQKGAVGIILHNSSRKATEDLLFGSPFTESLNIPVVYIARLPYNKIRKIKTGTCTLSVEIDRTISKPANVIGWINNKSAKTVIIGAHYDHEGIKPWKSSADKSPQVFNGADDNASGTAVLLELATWAVNNKTLKYNYIFVAFSAEEKGLFGSKAFSSRAWINNENIVYMMNLDMVGRLGCQGDTISVLGVASSHVWDQVIDKVEHPDFSIKRINGAPPFSDHAPFLKKGIPVIYFTTGLHPDYHTPKDDTELINFKGMAELTSYIESLIRLTESLPAIPFHKINAVQHTKAYIQTF